MPEVGGQLLANTMPNTQVSALGSAAPGAPLTADVSQSASDFNDLLLQQWLLSHPDAAQDMDLTQLASATGTNPMDGNELPPAMLLQLLQANPFQSQLQQPTKFDLAAFMQNGIPADDAALPVDGLMQTRLTMQRPVDAAAQQSIQSPVFLSDNMKLMDSAEISTRFNELDLLGTKPLQMFTQSQLHVSPDMAGIPNMSSAPAFTLNQSLSTYSSQAHLPPITAPLDQHQGLEQLNERINWMINSQIQKVDMRLEPAELGSLDVRVTVTKDQANVSFHVGNAMARDAIESAIPRLREMFNEAGVQLGNVDVSQHSFAENSNSNQSDSAEFQAASPRHQSEDVMADTDFFTTRVTGSNSLLDVFA